jgi:hypothetical protein
MQFFYQNTLSKRFQNAFKSFSGAITHSNVIILINPRHQNRKKFRLTLAQLFR